MDKHKIVKKYEETIRQLNKNKCWACEECLPGTSIHDCQQDFFMQVEYFFEEATYLVSEEILKTDPEFPGLTNVQDAIWKLLGFSFMFIIKEALYRLN